MQIARFRALLYSSLIKSPDYKIHITISKRNSHKHFINKPVVDLANFSDQLTPALKQIAPK